MTLIKNPLVVSFLLATLILAPKACKALTAEQVLVAAGASVVVVMGDHTEQHGSGVVVSPQMVITSCRVTGDARDIVVRQGAISHAARRVSADRVRDICLLDVPTLDTPSATFAPTSSLRPGARAYALGVSATHQPALSSGVISPLRQSDAAPLVQITASISPGWSGGGLFDDRARLIGVLSWQVQAGRAPNFAIPGNWVRTSIASAGDARRCRAAPTSDCLFALALGAARGIAAARDRGSSLAGIAHAQARADDRAGARQTFLEALSAVRENPDDGARQFWLGLLAMGQARTGDVAGSLATVSEMADGVWRWQALALTSRVQAERGDAAAALVSARNITSTRDRVRPLVVVAVAQARGGDRSAAANSFNEAIELARGDAEPGWRDSLLEQVVEGQSTVADISAARATALGITSGPTRSRVLASIPAFQARAGDTTGAFASVRLISGDVSAYEMGLALRAIATAQLEKGDVAGAQITARLIIDESMRNLERQFGRREVARLISNEQLHQYLDSAMDLYSQIAQAQAQSGDVAGALATVRGIRVHPVVGQPLALGAIAVAQARADALNDGLATARSIVDLPQRVQALRDIALTLGRRGDQQAATRALAEALDVASRLPDPAPAGLFGNPPPSAVETAHIAVTQATTGDAASAVAIGRRISVPFLRNSTLGEIASALAAAGEAAAALAVSEEIEQDEARAVALAGIAERLAVRR